MQLDSAALTALLKARLPADPPLALPPPCLTDMQGEPLDFEDGIALRMRFPVLARYRNPLGFMQGGYVAAALDNTIGPFSYLIAPPSVTSQLNLSYLRPIGPDVPELICIARVTERATKTLYLTGEARLPNGKLAVLAHAVCQLV